MEEQETFISNNILVVPGIVNIDLTEIQEKQINLKLVDLIGKSLNSVLDLTTNASKTFLGLYNNIILKPDDQGTLETNEAWSQVEEELKSEKRDQENWARKLKLMFG